MCPGKSQEQQFIRCRATCAEKPNMVLSLPRTLASDSVSVRGNISKAAIHSLESCRLRKAKHSSLTSYDSRKWHSFCARGHLNISNLFVEKIRPGEKKHSSLLLWQSHVCLILVAGFFHSVCVHEGACVSVCVREGAYVRACVWLIVCIWLSMCVINCYLWKWNQKQTDSTL